MKKDGRYRYSLQFPDDSEENIRAGELLERLGNKKSTVIVAALNEYIQSHPELGQGSVQLQISVTPSRDMPLPELEKMVRELVRRNMGMENVQPEDAGDPVSPAADTAQEGQVSAVPVPEGQMQEEQGHIIPDSGEQAGSGIPADPASDEDVSAMLGNLSVFDI